MIDSSRAQYLLQKQVIEMNRKSPLILQISGNSYSILRQSKKGIQKGDYKYLKINVSGTGVQSFGYCLFYTLITLTILFFFPLFLFFSDCVKSKLYMLFNINLEAYEAIAEIITVINPIQCYIVVQDNYFDQNKSAILLAGLQRTAVQKIQFVNIANSINVIGNNYSNFNVYMKQIGKISKKSRCRWNGKSA